MKVIIYYILELNVHYNCIGNNPHSQRAAIANRSLKSSPVIRVRDRVRYGVMYTFLSTRSSPWQTGFFAYMWLNVYCVKAFSKY